MEQNNSRLRKQVIWFVLTGIFAIIIFFGILKPGKIIIQYQNQTEKPGIPPAWAAAPQVKGSPNVAVTSYTTSDGKTYELWSDGHITDTSNNSTVTASGAYPSTSPSGFTDPTNQGFGITGSGRVAIGIVPTSGATYINFSNGTVRDPGSPANKPLASGPWTRASGNIYPTTLTDNVGIGTTNPGAKLDVNGSFKTQSMNTVIHTNSLTGDSHFAVIASCGAGGTVLGGGCYDSCAMVDGGTGNTAIAFSYPNSSSSWRCSSRTVDQYCTRTLTAYAICTQ